MDLDPLNVASTLRFREGYRVFGVGFRIWLQVLTSGSDEQTVESDGHTCGRVCTLSFEAGDLDPLG